MTSTSDKRAAATPTAVRALLLENNVLTDTDWALDAELIASGKMDSLDLVKMIAVFEEEFGVQIPDEALEQQNFETCESISRTLSAHED